MDLTFRKARHLLDFESISHRRWPELEATQATFHMDHIPHSTWKIFHIPCRKCNHFPSSPIFDTLIPRGMCFCSWVYLNAQPWLILQGMLQQRITYINIDATFVERAKSAVDYRLTINVKMSIDRRSYLRDYWSRLLEVITNPIRTSTSNRYRWWLDRGLLDRWLHIEIVSISTSSRWIEAIEPNY